MNSEVKDFIDFFLQVRGSVYFYWNFWIFGLIAFSGWWYTFKEKYGNKPLTQSIQTVALGGFTLICVISLTRQYSLLEAIRSELKLLVDVSLQSRDFYDQIINVSYAWAGYGVPIICGIIFFGYLFVIWWSPDSKGNNKNGLSQNSTDVK